MLSRILVGSREQERVVILCNASGEFGHIQADFCLEEFPWHKNSWKTLPKKPAKPSPAFS